MVEALLKLKVMLRSTWNLARLRFDAAGAAADQTLKGLNIENATLAVHSNALWAWLDVFHVSWVKRQILSFSLCVCAREAR